MRFIIGFVFFALLFYAIYIYFPDAFNTMVSWDAKVFDFLRDGVNKIIPGNTHPATPAPNAPQALFMLMHY